MNHWEQAQKTSIVQEEDPSRSDIRKQVPPHWMPPPFSANTSSSVCVCVCSGVTRSESKSKTSFPFSPLDRQLVRFKGGRPIRLCQETTVSRPDLPPTSKVQDTSKKRGGILKSVLFFKKTNNIPVRSK